MTLIMIVIGMMYLLWKAIKQTLQNLVCAREAISAERTIIYRESTLKANTTVWLKMSGKSRIVF